MDYGEIFLPTLSYVAHLVETRPGGVSAADGQTAADLRTLVGRANAQRHKLEARGFDMAWFAVAAWAEEKLRAVPGGRQLADGFFPPGKAGGGDFFERLEFLLTPIEGDIADAWRTGILNVYALCLDLGYRGRFNHDKFHSRLTDYRRRCRKALAAAGDEARRRALRRRGRRASRCRQAVRAAVMWSAPALITIALYSLYRLFLADLYAGVIG